MGWWLRRRCVLGSGIIGARTHSRLRTLLSTREFCQHALGNHHLEALPRVYPLFRTSFRGFPCDILRAVLFTSRRLAGAEQYSGRPFEDVGAAPDGWVPDSALTMQRNTLELISFVRNEQV